MVDAVLLGSWSGLLGSPPHVADAQAEAAGAFEGIVRTCALRFLQRIVQPTPAPAGDHLYAVERDIAVRARAVVDFLEQAFGVAAAPVCTVLRSGIELQLRKSSASTGEPMDGVAARAEVAASLAEERAAGLLLRMERALAEATVLRARGNRLAEALRACEQRLSVLSRGAPAAPRP
jgi:hypothetical protein